jgi:hypothetical protein
MSFRANTVAVSNEQAFSRAYALLADSEVLCKGVLVFAE